MSTKITLYGVIRSPPVRAVRLTLNALNVDYTYHELNSEAGELKSPEYLKKNPQHTVPTLEDDGKYLVDSHAICAYLVRKYAKDDSLYPKDFYQRAIVDHRLHYENGVMFFGCLRQSVLPVLTGTGNKEHLAEAVRQLEEIYKMLEVFLGDNQYIAGKQLTIADFSIVATVSSVVYLAPVVASQYPKLAAWLERMQKLPYYEQANGKGPEILRTMMAEKIKELK